MSRKSRKNEAFDLPSFQMIRAASNGDIEAINAVLKHYEGYIAALYYNIINAMVGTQKGGRNGS